jgi:hypothetical protein
MLPEAQDSGRRAVGARMDPSSRVACAMLALLGFAAGGLRAQAAATGPNAARSLELPESVRERCAAHAETVRKRLPGPSFTIVVEPPFVVVGDGGAAAVERSAVHTVRWARERLRADFFKLDPDRVLEVWLFDGKASYQKHTRQVFGDVPTTPYGYYSSRHGALIMNIATGGGTLVHEIVHPYVEANVPDCPSWINEGLGSLFEQSTDRDGHIRGLVNWRLDGLQKAIDEQRTVPLAELVKTTTAEFYGERSGLHYAEARYLLLWLQEHDLLLKFWKSWLEARADDATGAATLAKVLEVEDLDAFQPRFEAWCAALRRD